MRNPNCRACPLGRDELQNVCVMGRVGDFKSIRSNWPIMLIGEAPGFHEDSRGKPFVGPAGVVLQRCLVKAEVAELCYITNAVKCRPPNNRPPNAEEVIKCSNLYLDSELKLVNPQIIVVLGGVASSLFDPPIVKGVIDVRQLFDRMWMTIGTWHPAMANKDSTMAKENDIVATLSTAKDHIF